MRDPHVYRRMMLLLCTPIGWAMVVGFNLARLVRDVIHPNQRKAGL